MCINPSSPPTHRGRAVALLRTEILQRNHTTARSAYYPPIYLAQMFLIPLLLYYNVCKNSSCATIRIKPPPLILLCALNPLSLYYNTHLTPSSYTIMCIKPPRSRAIGPAAVVQDRRLPAPPRQTARYYIVVY
jgi:hypothetical protein